MHWKIIILERRMAPDNQEISWFLRKSRVTALSGTALSLDLFTETTEFKSTLLLVVTQVRRLLEPHQRFEGTCC
jgi:hypothetical protein